MPFNGSGVFTRVHNWVTDRTNSVKVRADRMDEEDDGIAAGLSNCITRDGQSTVSADIPFNNKKITGLGDATGATHAMNRQASDARYMRNPTDLSEEASVVNADIFGYYDTSGTANKKTTFENLRAKIFAPAGTRQTFQQSAAPTGWTKDTTHNNKALRIVSGTVVNGGDTPFTTVFGDRTIALLNLPNHNVGVSITDPGHDHSYVRPNNAVSSYGGGSNNAVPGFLGGTTGTSFTGITATGTFSNAQRGGAQTAMDFNVQYVDVILATKD